MLNAFRDMAKRKHEQLVVCFDHESGLCAGIAIHNTVLGPAIGGTRLWKYHTSKAAVSDALRLSEAMTYKAAIAGLPLGGGKAVILADGKENDPNIRGARLKAFGRFVDSLGGRYITAEDVGTNPEDMTQIKSMTRYVVGIPHEQGGSGDPCPVTAFGVMQGMRALAEEVLGLKSLAGVRVALQGLGGVGTNLARLLVTEDAVVIGTDIRPEVAEEAKNKLNIDIVEPQAIYEVPCHIFAPCALGGVINDRTIPRLKCKIIAGSANNPLENERLGEKLHELGILYGVDYVINAGGLINVAQELEGYDESRALEKTADIYHTVKHLLAISNAAGISTQRAAQKMALEAIGRAS